ncbi:MAG: DinB family protein [Bacteroidota bacterium]
MPEIIEVWLRGPVDGVPALLQPAAHAILQAREEINAFMKNFPDALLWEKPAGMASAGFHLQHISGILDRLFTYARDEQLSADQLKYLSSEGKTQETVTTNQLIEKLNDQVDIAISHLQNTNSQTLTEQRVVGRKQIPSTVIGLLFHAAEHTQRHTGQLLVTAKIIWQQ